MESLFNKVAGFKDCKFIKKRLQHGCFPVNIAKFFRTTILKNICEWLEQTVKAVTAPSTVSCTDHFSGIFCDFSAL